jgi:hypothetical protein
MLPLRRLTRQPTTAIDLSVPRPTLTIVGPARGSNRYLPVSLWCSFMDARAAEAERKAPRHRGRDAAFVKEGEFLRIDREDVLVELGAPDTVEFAVSFDRVGRLSFSRGPSRRTDRCTRPELIEKHLSERIRSRNSARVRSCCDLTKPSMWILTASFTLLRIQSATAQHAPSVPSQPVAGAACAHIPNSRQSAWRAHDNCPRRAHRLPKSSPADRLNRLVPPSSSRILRQRLRESLIELLMGIAISSLL